MKSIILMGSLLAGCVSKPICENGNDGFSSVLDPQKRCKVRIRQVILGSDLDLPKSISFKSSEMVWSYKWIETAYKDGALELGHFALYPSVNEGASIER